KSNKVAHEMNDSNPKFPPSFTPQHSDHYEYKKVEALRESTTLQDSKKVRNDQTFHQILEESINKSSGVSKTTHADSMASPVKQRNRLFDFATSLARGRSGGILCVWDKLLFHKKRTYATEHCLCVEDTWMSNNADLLFISVYYLQELSLKRVLWNDMLETLNRWHGEVIIIGDFNEVRFASEHHGSYFHSLNATEFNMFIANSLLIDISLGGYSFTWSDKHARKMNKLDRFLVSQRMLDLFLNLTEDDFHSVIEDSWNNDGISASNSMILLKNKLNFLKQRLKE
nr:RNA-directed DNA polymerase, eukaryota [Tanacetum cinerariifolium]